jgi:hypothetical protein
MHRVDAARMAFDRSSLIRHLSRIREAVDAATYRCIGRNVGHERAVSPRQVGVWHQGGRAWSARAEKSFASLRVSGCLDVERAANGADATHHVRGSEH